MAEEVELECPGLKPMQEWLEETDKDGECRPCILSAYISSYQQELISHGKEELAQQLSNSLNDEDPVLSVAKMMDNIKSSVDEKIKSTLLALDCMAQNYDGKEVTE